MPSATPAVSLFIINAINTSNYYSHSFTPHHAAEGPSAVAIVAVRLVYSTEIEAQVVSLRSRNSGTRPVKGVPSKAVKRGTIHAAGTDKVVRISINERIAIRSVGSISRAAKVCAGGKDEEILPILQTFQLNVNM